MQTFFSPTRSENESNSAPVAVLDSGIGGIGVLREIRALLPQENLLYFGDSKNAPYGERDREALCTLICAHAERLLKVSKALVLACNTATAVAARALRAAHPNTPIIGMEPAVVPALLTAPHPRILILATATTLREKKLEVLLSRHAARATFVCVAAPRLVRLVEAGLGDSAEAETYLKELLAPHLSPLPDAIVLGCTHFPFAKAAISRALPSPVPFFDGAAGTAHELRRRLAANGLLNGQAARGIITLTASDSTALPRYLAFLAK